MACRKCHRDHEPVSLAEWSWQVRDYKPKPPPGHLGVLWMLAAILDPKTGCGWASRGRLAEAANASTDTVDRALAWGQRHMLINRAARGHRAGDGSVRASEWQLIARVNSAPLRS